MYTDCKVGYCQDVTNRAKDRIEVQGGKISVKDLEAFQGKNRSRIIMCRKLKLEQNEITAK